VAVDVVVVVDMGMIVAVLLVQVIVAAKIMGVGLQISQSFTQMVSCRRLVQVNHQTGLLLWFGSIEMAAGPTIQSCERFFWSHWQEGANALMCETCALSCQA
jgi:hypothetical protein